MSHIRRIKRVLRGVYANLRSKSLSLPGGTYHTKYDVVHFTERCGWKQFGARNDKDYEHWRQEACGIVSLQTVTNAVHPETLADDTIFEQIQDAINGGAYLQYKKGTETIRVGWIHDKLVDIAVKRGVRGYSASLTIAAICQAITKDRLVIASVYRPFVRFIEKDAPRKKQGGHLVVVKGFSWENGQCTGLFVEDPYDIDERTEAIEATLFEDVYSGSAVVFYA